MQVYPTQSPSRYGGPPPIAGAPTPFATVPLGQMGMSPEHMPGVPPVDGDAVVVVNTIDLPRPRWRNRASFVCAVLGTLIGLGNWWRFPDLMNRYGGGPFLITYFLSIGIIGIPLMYLEIGLGQRMQRSAIGAFGGIHPRVRGVGFVAVLTAFVVASYYMAIVGLSALYFVRSWYHDLPWGWTTQYNPPSEACQNLFPHRGMYHYFVEVTESYTRDYCVPRSMWDSDGIAWPWWGATAVSYVILLIVLCRGVKSVSIVTFLATGIPFALLIVLFVRGVSLGGISVGAHWYIQRWEWKALLNPYLWAESVVQVFLTLAVCLGIMPAYGSYNPRDAPQLVNVLIIAVLNFIFSFLAGFAIFGAIGHFAVQTGIQMLHTSLPGWQLTFLSYPMALSVVPGPNVWNVLLYILLFLLSLHGVVGLVISVAAAILDIPWRRGRETLGDHLRAKWRGWHEFIVILLVCLAAWIPSFLWTSDVGMMWITAVHHWVQNYLLLVIGLAEAIVVAWIWPIITPTAYRWNYRKSAVWFTIAFLGAVAAFAAVAVAAAVDLAPCTDVAWQFNDGTPGGSTYTCGKYQETCDFKSLMINDQEYFVASHAVWSRCPAYPTLPLAGAVGENQMLLPASAASPCVFGVAAQDCRVGGELPIAIAVGLVLLVAGWYISWNKARATVGQWWHALGFAGTDQIVKFYAWAERLRVPSALDVPLGLGLGGVDFFASVLFWLWTIFVKYAIPPLLLVLLFIVFKWDVTEPPIYAPGLVQLVMWLMVGLPWLFSLLYFFSPGAIIPDPSARDVLRVTEFNEWINAPDLQGRGAAVPPQAAVLEAREVDVIRV